jgi:hypothetical protein
MARTRKSHRSSCHSRNELRNAAVRGTVSGVVRAVIDWLREVI